MRLLLADADPARSLAIGAALAIRGCTVDRVDTADGLAQSVRGHDVVLIAWRLRDVPAREVVGNLRARGLHAPVAVLSAPRPRAVGRHEVAEAVAAFSAGADDVVPEGIDPDELTARLHAVHRRDRTRTRDARVLALGPAALNRDSREVHVHGRPVRLTPTEFAILELLVLREGAPLSRRAIMDHLYGGRDEPGDRIVDVCLCKLRKKLAEARAADLIGTVWGAGYVAREPGQGPKQQRRRPRPDGAKQREIAGRVIGGDSSIHAAARSYGLTWRAVAEIVARHRDQAASWGDGSVSPAAPAPRPSGIALAMPMPRGSSTSASATAGASGG